MTYKTLDFPAQHKKVYVPEWLLILKSFYHFCKSLKYLRYLTAEDGSVTVTHSISGSSVTYRADGNIDFDVARNMKIGTHNKLLLNCNPSMDKQ